MFHNLLEKDSGRAVHITNEAHGLVEHVQSTTANESGCESAKMFKTHDSLGAEIGS